VADVGAQRHEGHEIFGIIGRQRQRDEGGEGGDLDDDQHGVDAGTLLGADDEQPGDGNGDDDGGQVDEAAGIGAVDKGCGKLDAGEALQHADRIAGPADGHRAGGHRIFEDQRPADDPGHQFAERGVAVGIGGAGNRDHGGQFGIAERGQRADHAGHDEADEHTGAGKLGGFGGEDENAGADDAADTEHGQLEGAKRTGETLFFSRCQNCVERLDPPVCHVDLPPVDPCGDNAPNGAAHATRRIGSGLGPSVKRVTQDKELTARPDEAGPPQGAAKDGDCIGDGGVWSQHPQARRPAGVRTAHEQQAKRERAAGKADADQKRQQAAKAGPGGNGGEQLDVAAAHHAPGKQQQADGKDNGRGGDMRQPAKAGGEQAMENGQHDQRDGKLIRDFEAAHIADGGSRHTGQRRHCQGGRCQFRSQPAWHQRRAVCVWSHSRLAAARLS